MRSGGGVDRYALQRSPHLLLVCDTPKGRGVFASQQITAGSIIETCPVLVLDAKENEKHIARTTLYHYTYNWPLSTSRATTGKVEQTQAVIFGLGSLFNHSFKYQNVGWTRDLEREVVVYHALRDIAEGEELCISYGNRLTFIDADAATSDSEEDPTAMLSKIET